MAASSWRCVTLSCARTRCIRVTQYRPTFASSNLLFYRSSSTSVQPEDYFERNKRLNRPLSPHLSILIKNPEPITLFSISHRITGAILSFDAWALTITWLCTGRNFPQLMETIQAMSIHPYLLVAGKFVIALPFTYHLFNAMRHLNWDMGRGFDLPTAHRTGYLVFTLAILSAIGLSLYSP